MVSTRFVLVITFWSYQCLPDFLMDPRWMSASVKQWVAFILLTVIYILKIGVWLRETTIVSYHWQMRSSILPLPCSFPDFEAWWELCGQRKMLMDMMLLRIFIGICLVPQELHRISEIQWRHLIWLPRRWGRGDWAWIIGSNLFILGLDAEVNNWWILSNDLLIFMFLCRYRKCIIWRGILSFHLFL